MSSVSSLETTAASDECHGWSSADSGHCSDRDGGIRRPTASRLRHRRATSTSKLARSSRVKSEMAKQQKVMCGCRGCAGKRIVSKSTCYRHLRIEAEIADDDAKWEARWSSL